MWMKNMLVMVEMKMLMTLAIISIVLFMVTAASIFDFQ